MAGPKYYRRLELLAAPPTPPVDAELEALRQASRAARRAELEAAHAKELAEQADLRAQIALTERIGVTSHSRSSEVA